MTKTDKENQQRKQKYEQLINAGYSAREATIYKDRSQELVDILCAKKAQELDKGLKSLNLIKSIIDPKIDD